MLARWVITSNRGENERAHGFVLGTIWDGSVPRIVLHRQYVRKILVPLIIIQVNLAGGVDCHDTSPDEDQDWTEILTCSLEESGNVREDTNG